MSDLSKRVVTGSLVKLLYHRQEDRGMRLMPFETRCMLRREIHELVTTDQSTARPGEAIDRVGFLGFAEIEVGGVVERGDPFLLDGRQIGIVLGFDGCHLPNHLNVLVATAQLETASSVGLGVGSPVRFGAADLPVRPEGSRLNS